MTVYDTEIEAGLPPEDEDFGEDDEAYVSFELEDDADREEEDPVLASPEAGIFDADEVYQADEHILHDEVSDRPDDEEAASEREAPFTERVQAALRQGFWAVAVRLMIAAGERDEKRLTNLVFQSRHPGIGGRRIRPDEKHLATEWLTIRDQIVRPLLPASGGRRPPVLSSAALRAAWHEYLNAEHRMKRLRLFERWNTPVNPDTVGAWQALERALTGAGYMPHRAWVYVPRDVAKTNTPSLHAYGLAIDVDHREPKCNVNRPTPDKRLVRFSSGATKDDRCRDVRSGTADTSFTAAQVAAVEAIRTVDGYQVFTWGGRWKTTKDTMHFQINVTPEELRRGLA